MKPILVGLCSLTLAATLAACEQMPEEFTFVNDTNDIIIVRFYEPAVGPYDQGTIAPGASYTNKLRPVALHMDKWFADIDDEEQFRYLMRDGATLITESGDRLFLDVISLRRQMDYAPPRRFTMHIHPGLFEPAR